MHSVPQKRAIKLMAEYMNDLDLPETDTVAEDAQGAVSAQKPEDIGNMMKAVQLSKWMISYSQKFIQLMEQAASQKEGTPEFLKAVDGVRIEFYRIRQTCDHIATEITKISENHGLPPLDI